MPRIEAVMPTRNQMDWLPAALNSVYPQVDLLVCVNDDSTDDTNTNLHALSVGRPNMRIVTLSRRLGTGGAINCGVELLRPGPDTWWTWVSSDNTHLPCWRKTMEAHCAGDVGAIYSAFFYKRGPDRQHVVFRPYSQDMHIRDENCLFGPSFLIHSEIWNAVGGHRGAISHDYDHWARIEEECWRQGKKIIGEPEPLCIYNAHDQRRTLTERDSYDAGHWRQEAIKRRHGQ